MNQSAMLHVLPVQLADHFILNLCSQAGSSVSYQRVTMKEHIPNAGQPLWPNVHRGLCCNSIQYELSGHSYHHQDCRIDSCNGPH